MTQIPIALQLYSVREDAERDLSGTLAAVAKMGYAGVEFAGFYGHAAADVKKMLDDNGLQIAGAHIGLDTLRGKALPQTIAFHQTLGNRFLIVPGLAEEHRASQDAWQKTAQTMNEIAARLQPEGMQTGYHNHDIEFKALDGELPWDTFFANTRPEVVMQFDTGNAMHGGADPIPFLERYPGRATTVHLKEYSKTNPDALIGEGDIPWTQVFALCEQPGNTQWYIVEQEAYAYPPLECGARCLENLRKMGR